VPIEEAEMTKTDHDPESYLPLSSAVFHILLALVDEERHGYGIMQEVEARTEGEVHLAPGTLYGAIKRLLQRGLIAETDEWADPELDDERRRYYRLTKFGLRVLEAEAARLASLVRQAQAKRLLPGLSGSRS
jgi:DNA-binding PadR family transcriptional regulator